MNNSIVQLLTSQKLNSAPTSNANRNVREAYDRWVKANEKARVYILVSMSDVLAKKHKSLAMVKEIMDSLREMFGQPSWSLRHEAIKNIYTKQMKEGTSTIEHVLDMMMHFNIVEVNGGPINEEVEANVATTEKELVRGSSYKTRVGTLNMKNKRKRKTPKNSEGKKVAKGKCYHCNETIIG
ncbi:gag/pol protein [Cucumis melo var. makuwa]|uniref:Gag/pol protein n=1 Tax=Cucumis melo var. makuwa TaxID=1194695 RepID=A0A5A7V7G6_CUCMM|nr:gag/pol protein [Cucumis melo var. makuwa]